jgi:putative DNA primase/helicase
MTSFSANSLPALATALTGLELGLSVIPIAADGSKRPGLASWTEYQQAPATPAKVQNWFNLNPFAGVGLVCGPVSKNLELFEFDDFGCYKAFKQAALDFDLAALVNRIEAGYSEQTPGGGIHWLYYLAGAESVPGNTKLAQQVKTDAAGNPVLLTTGKPEIKTLIETRGRGGLVVIAPSGGRVHSTGKDYKVLKGSLETITSITPEEHKQLWNLARSFDDMPDLAAPPAPPKAWEPKAGPAGNDNNDLRPGDDFNRRADWHSDILGPAGWRVLTRAGSKTFWQRPGKSGPGWSGTTGYIGAAGGEVFVCFSSSVSEFEEKKGYGKFVTYARLFHNSDYSAAGKALAAKGYGQSSNTGKLIMSREKWLENRGYVADDMEQSEPVEKAAETILEAAPGQLAAAPVQEEKPVAAGQWHLTELGNALRLVHHYGDMVRFVKEWGWLVWDGARWKMDKTGQAAQYAKKTVKTIYTQAGQEESESRSKALAVWAMKSESKAGINNMLSLAETEPAIRAVPGQFDTNPMLLNCLNGTIDLNTGQLAAPDREHLITKLAPVNYDPAAVCPAWLEFLNFILAGNTDLIDFLQRAIGYSLTGSTVEQVMFLLWGTGRNGKSTLLEVIGAMLGDYLQASSFSTFLEKDNNDGPRNDIAGLAGSRLVTAVEADPGKRLAESVIKQLTGGDTISARFLHREYFEFKPSFKIFLAANHKPVIRGQDLGIWRRIKLLPFEVTIPEEQVNKHLPEVLRAELAGILAWAVRGCLAWQKEGLKVPAKVKAATEAYQEESDLLRDFIADRAIRGKNKKVELSKFYKAYTVWCEEAGGERPLGKQRFSQCLTERGIVVGAGPKNKSFYFGIDLALPDQAGQTAQPEAEENSLFKPEDEEPF